MYSCPMEEVQFACAKVNARQLRVLQANVLVFVRAKVVYCCKN